MERRLRHLTCTKKGNLRMLPPIICRGPTVPPQRDIFISYHGEKAVETRCRKGHAQMDREQYRPSVRIRLRAMNSGFIQRCAQLLRKMRGYVGSIGYSRIGMATRKRDQMNLRGHAPGGRCRRASALCLDGLVPVVVQVVYVVQNPRPATCDLYTSRLLIDRDKAR